MHDCQFVRTIISDPQRNICNYKDTGTDYFLRSKYYRFYYANKITVQK